MRRTYLITYSGADLEHFPTRESFGLAIAEASIQVQGEPSRWQEGLYVALKLSGPKRWLSVKNVLNTHYDMVVSFSKSHHNYYSAYKFITNIDTEVIHSGKHPNLKEMGSPRAKQSTKAYKNKKKTVDKNSDVAA